MQPEARHAEMTRATPRRCATAGPAHENPSVEAFLHWVRLGVAGPTGPPRRPGFAQGSKRTVSSFSFG